MFEFHEKRKIKKILYAKGTFLLFGVCTFFVSFAAYNAYSKLQSAIERKDERAVELAELERHAAQLEEDIQKFEDPRGVEAELRSRYEVGREGEEMIILVEEEQPSSPASEKIEETEGFWSTIVHTLF